MRNECYRYLKITTIFPIYNLFRAKALYEAFVTNPRLKPGLVKTKNNPGFSPEIRGICMKTTISPAMEPHSPKVFL